MNNKLDRMAVEKGFENTREFLADLLGRHKTYVSAAEEIGVSASCVTQGAKRHGLFRAQETKKDDIQKQLAEYNRKNGTQIKTSREYIAEMAKKFGTDAAVEITGASRQYVRRCEMYGTGPEVVYQDTTPSNLSGPWTNPDKSPCHECDHKKRDKNQPGCVMCELRMQYVSLIEVIKTNSFVEPAPYHGYGANMGWNQVY